MYMAGGSIFRSTSGGGSWINLGALPYNALSMDASATGTDTVYVGVIPVSAGQPALIYRATNGTTFTNISGSQLPSRYPTDIYVNPNNSADVYVTLGGFGSGHIYRSTNAGVTWNNISGNLPDVPHQTVCIDPLYPANIYAGNDLGVYASSNGGASWFEFRNGMPYAMVFDLTIVYPGRNIRAVTHGSGIYERDLMSNIVGISQISNEAPKNFSLGQNYPNPFNPETKIKFSIPAAGERNSVNTSISIYDITGRLVKTLINGYMKPGIYELSFNASELSTGIYYYRLNTGEFSDTKKMVLLK
jgi:hypothetical protein